ncbi:MAG: ATP-dependent DNA helicase PcrA [Deltaproteobacteria bacterium]|nr:MAG: ATP-dependent DNA helicase PcrA [Deltaproteobacteria bacterium]
MKPDEPRHLARLNPEQRTAVTTLDGPVLVLAGAGSGKTRVLTRRIAHLLHTGVDPEHILAVTFTNKAANEMKERVVELVGEIGSKVWVSTFHASCGRILRKDIEALGWTRKFSIYDDDDQIRVMRQLIADRGWDLKDRPPGPFLRRIDQFKNMLLSPEAVLAQRRTHRGDPLMDLWEDYEQSLRASDAVDFNDLIGLVVRLFEEHPDVLETWREKFHYLLVDEYQDTNRAQYRVLRLLAEGHRNLCCVGDDDQSIYGFRGADITNILDFQKDYHDALVIRMEQNYRCSKNILTLANAVVARNTGRIDKKLWTQASEGPMINVLVAPSPDAEAALVCRAIRQLQTRGTPLDDIVILYRSNSTARPFERALGRAGIAYEVVGGRSFWERREIRDLVAYLRLVVNPADDASFLRICNVPTRGLGPVALSALRDAANTRGEPLLATARANAQGSDRRAKALSTFVQLMDQLTITAKEVSAPALIRELLDRSGYLDMLTDEDTSESRQRLRSLEELVQRAATVEAQEGAGGIERLQSWLDLATLDRRDDEDADAEDAQARVTLMTVHTSKGLEFPVVFVVQMMEGTFPHQRSLETEAGIEEERRLAYVAFTRAKERLIITRSLELPRHGARRTLAKQAPASRFLYGMPEAVVVGEVPSGAPPDLIDGEPLDQSNARLRRFLRHRKPGQGTPPSSITTADLERIDQLSPGARVFHPRLGLGRVRALRGPTGATQVHITFDDKRSMWVPLAMAGLQLVVHEDTTPTP